MRNCEVQFGFVFLMINYHYYYRNSASILPDVIIKVKCYHTSKYAVLGFWYSMI